MLLLTFELQYKGEIASLKQEQQEFSTVGRYDAYDTLQQR